MAGPQAPVFRVAASGVRCILVMDSATSEIRAVEFTPPQRWRLPRAVVIAWPNPSSEETGTVTPPMQYMTPAAAPPSSTDKPLRLSRSTRSATVQRGLSDGSCKKRYSARQ